MVSEVQFLGVKVGFGNFDAVSDAFSSMVNASESESLKFVDQQGMVSSRVFPVPDGVAVEVADKQRRCGRQVVSVPINNLMSDPDILEVFVADVGPQCDDVHAVHSERNMPGQETSRFVEGVGAARVTYEAEAFVRVGSDPGFERSIRFSDMSLRNLL